MADRADAHIHLFEGGYQGGSFASRPGVTIDEAACYASLMADYDVKAALVVGYCGAPWCASNSTYLVDVMAAHDWVRPAVHVEPGEELTPDVLDAFCAQGFVGLTLYVSGDDQAAALARVPEATWARCAERHCLVSVNAKGDDWLAWRPILERTPDLRLVLSHCGLPPAVSDPPDAEAARSALASVTGLANFPGPRVKLSGFYALTEPRWDYPHRAAWPYVEALVEAYGLDRLLWASDFTPCLNWLSFPQTLGLFQHMSFLTEADREAIEGGNLLRLLSEVQ